MSDTITITGNIVAAPQQRRLPSGVPVTSFSVASTHRRYDADAKEWVDQYTTYYDVQVFRALGEHAFDSLRGGQRVIVVGRQRLREWDTGEKRGKSLEIEADAVGHDLLWGTTVYTKSETRHSSQPTEGSTLAGDDEWGERAAEGEGATGTLTPADAEAEADPTLVGAPTPF